MKDETERMVENSSLGKTVICLGQVGGSMGRHWTAAYESVDRRISSYGYAV